MTQTLQVSENSTYNLIALSERNSDGPTAYS